jgi:hypothetical protein
MNLKPWPYKLITLGTPVYHSNSNCPIPGVQSNPINVLTGCQLRFG